MEWIAESGEGVGAGAVCRWRAVRGEAEGVKEWWAEEAGAGKSYSGWRCMGGNDWAWLTEGLYKAEGRRDDGAIRGALPSRQSR